LSLVNEAASEADGDGVRPAPCLELCQEVPHVALHRLLGEDEPNADLSVHEAVGDQLEDLDLAGGRLLLQFLQRRPVDSLSLGRVRPNE
jgi:hypothetical protein